MTSAKFKIKSFTLLAASALVIAAIIGFGSVGSSAARTTVHASSPVGLAAGQRASFHWTNLSDRQVGYEMFFLDADGRVLKVSRGLLLPARSIALELAYNELGSRGLRGHARAVLRVIGATTNPLPGIEVFDEVTGRTSFGLLLPAVVGFDPQPEPPGQQ